MSFITALFILSVALVCGGTMIAFVSSMLMLSPCNPEDEEKGTRLFKMSVIAVLVGAFIIGLTAQVATA